MKRISKAVPLKPYMIELSFDNGSAGTADLSKIVETDHFRPLVDEEFFRNFAITQGGTAVSWGNDLQLSAEILYRNMLTKGGTKKLQRPYNTLLDPRD